MRLAQLDGQLLDHRIEPADQYHGRVLPDGTTQWGGFDVDTFHEQEQLAGAEGVSFLCPKCFRENGGPKGTHSIMVFFEGAELPDRVVTNSAGSNVVWRSAGTDIDDLTLTPSIQIVGHCGWHGFVTNGEARDA